MNPRKRSNTRDITNTKKSRKCSKNQAIDNQSFLTSHNDLGFRSFTFLLQMHTHAHIQINHKS